MQNEELLDDFHFTPEDESEIYLAPASVGQRFLNYIIDNIVLRAFLYFGALFIGNSDFILGMSESMILLLVFLLFLLVIGYYWVSEFALGGRTIGKMITGTRVVYDDGSRPSATSILGRTLARAVPFEAFSIFFNEDRVMWHDQWSHTMVVDVKKSVLPQED